MKVGVRPLLHQLWSTGWKVKQLHFRNFRKEMFYLKTHSTHFIYGCVALDQKLQRYFSKRKQCLFFKISISEIKLTTKE